MALSNIKRVHQRSLEYLLQVSSWLKDGMSNKAADSCEPAADEEVAAKKIQAHFRGYKTRKEVKTMKMSRENLKKCAEPEADQDLEKAATKIQASFRGHKVRKGMKKPKPEPIPEPVPDPEEEVVDIDLSDPDVIQAATKIQNTFRGYQARKKN